MACDGEAHSGRRPGSNLVGVVRQRAKQHPRIPAAAERGHRRANTIAPVAWPSRRARTPSVEESRGVRPLPARTISVESADPGDESSRRRTLRARDRLDPQYSLAWAGLADAFAAVRSMPMPAAQVGPAHATPPRTPSPAVPTSPRASTSKGIVSYCSTGTGRLRRRRTDARSIHPHYPLAHRILGVLLGHDRSTRGGRSLPETDAGPRSDSTDELRTVGARRAAGAGRIRRSRIREAGDRHRPAFWIGYFQLAWAYERLGEPANGARSPGAGRSDVRRQQQDDIASRLHPLESRPPMTPNRSSAR